jgi:hypothetical protein
MHGRKDEKKILMATESTEEHGKIKSGLRAARAVTGVPAARGLTVDRNDHQ